MNTIGSLLVKCFLLVMFSGSVTLLKPQSPERRMFQDFTSEEVKSLAQQKKIVLIPVAQIENHGPYLPVGTDQLLGTEICRRAAEKDGNAIVGPPITLGNCSDFAAWPGYIVVTNRTFLAVVEDYLTSLKQQAFEKAVFFVMHGGHNFNTLDIAVSELNRTLKMKVHVASVEHLYSRFREDVMKLGRENINPELSMMLAFKPELVRRKDARHAALPQWPPLMSLGRYYDPALTLDKIAPDGFVLFSDKATPEIGQMLLEKSSTTLANEILKKMTD